MSYGVSEVWGIRVKAIVSPHLPCVRAGLLPGLSLILARSLPTGKVVALLDFHVKC